METDAPLEQQSAQALPAGLRTPILDALWAEACEWASWIFAVFVPATLRTTGISREQGARVSLWVRNIESALRRLILAAALKLTPAPPQRPASSRKHTRTPAARHAGFRVFGFRSANTPQPAPAQPRAPKPYGHISFPSDPLLRLGPATPSPQRTQQAKRPRHPLDRWVRLSRQDPDWRPPEDSAVQPEEDEDRFAWLFEDTTLDHRPPPKPRPARKPHDPNGFPDSLWDWRRCHDEWQKLVPAPTLAARLAAIARVTTNPAAVIASTARRLARPNNRGPRLFLDALPPDRIPKRARLSASASLTAELAEACHDALSRPDTS